MPDGLPDPGSLIPTYNGIIAATGGKNVATCLVNIRAGVAPPVVASVQSEYSVPMTAHIDGYVRGLVDYFGKSQNQPTNALDDVKSYALVNLYAGIRASNGAWDIGIYAKNIFDTERVLTRGAGPLTTSYNIGATGVNSPTTYRLITMTAPREIGATARFAFGSR